MNLADVSIRRPVFATMMIVALFVFGMLAYPRIGVDLFPEAEFPFVTTTIVYPGGDPETMESKVADPIEAHPDGGPVCRGVDDHLVGEGFHQRNATPAQLRIARVGGFTPGTLVGHRDRQRSVGRVAGRGQGDRSRLILVPVRELCGVREGLVDRQHT